MDKQRRREPIIVALDTLVPKDHLLRKFEKVMDYDWLYELLDHIIPKLLYEASSDNNRKDNA